MAYDESEMEIIHKVFIDKNRIQIIFVKSRE